MLNRGPRAHDGFKGVGNWGSGAVLYDAQPAYCTALRSCGGARACAGASQQQRLTGQKGVSARAVPERALEQLVLVLERASVAKQLSLARWDDTAERLLCLFGWEG